MAVVQHPDEVERINEFGRIVQLAYHAPDIKKTAQFWSDKFGAGPFYLLELIQLRECLYRGTAAPFNHSSAYGQLGDMMIELIHQHDDHPSPVRDMYDAQREGLHHAAVFVDDIDAALSKAASKDMACALDATTKDGDVRFVMVDARKSYGHMLEFYERTAVLTKFYNFIRRQSQGWDGREFLRKL